jgi:hypothetical protein
MRSFLSGTRRPSEEITVTLVEDEKIPLLDPNLRQPPILSHNLGTAISDPKDPAAVATVCDPNKQITDRRQGRRSTTMRKPRICTGGLFRQVYFVNLLSHAASIEMSSTMSITQTHSVRLPAMGCPIRIAGSNSMKCTPAVCCRRNTIKTQFRAIMKTGW